MSQKIRFRIMVPVLETSLAALSGGFGLWQRNQILSHPGFGGGTMWDTTARFHVWPWPFKFAVISNVPAFLAGLLLTLPIRVIWPTLSEMAALAPSLIFAALLWYWVGYRLDRRWYGATIAPPGGTRTPWVLLLVFTVVCLVGAFLPMGHVGYQPYGLVVWLVTAITIHKTTKRPGTHTRA
jgi:hypothetical protein